MLLPESGNLKHLINQDNKKEAYLLPINNPTGGGAGEYNRFHVLRLFKNNGVYRFQGKIHEQVVITKNELVGIADGPIIGHKLLTLRKRNRKRGRNLALLKKAIAEEPQNYFLRYYLGVEWLMLGKPALAAPLLEQAYTHITDEQLLFRSSALRYLIIAWESLGKTDQAIALCREAIPRYPEYTDLYYLCGVLWEEKKQFRAAAKWFEKAIKCGTPPALYSHLNGSGGFLAHYHLGFCYDMLGARDTANSHYEGALKDNPAFSYPVFSLFLNLLAGHGPEYTLNYLQKANCIERAKVALNVAKLFFIAGYPDKARRYLEHNSNIHTMAEECVFYLGKFCIYAGRQQQGLEYLEHIPMSSRFYLKAQLQRVLAHLMLGNFPAARALTIEMWKFPLTRPQAYVLLTLLRLLKTGQTSKIPLQVREIGLVEAALAMLKDCNHYMPGKSARQDSMLSNLVTGLETIIKYHVPGGYIALMDYYQNKLSETQQLLQHKLGRK